jgi:hypothetical protein
VCTTTLYIFSILNMFQLSVKIHNSYIDFTSDRYIVFRKLLRPCNLTSFSPCLTGPVDYLFASRHKGPRFKSLGGYLCEARILLLALSRYIGDPDVIDHISVASSEAGFVLNHH